MDCHERLREIDRGFHVARQIVLALLAQHELAERIKLKILDLRLLHRQLPDIFLVRMFASFESSLRSYWRAEVRNTAPVTQHLIESLARQRTVPQDVLDTVQKIRGVRNQIVHEDRGGDQRFQIEDALQPLNIYLARLPQEWKDPAP